MKNRYEVLDSFRGLAAIFVVLTHMNYINGISQLKFFQNSHVFVEFFFALSGFVLTHSYLNKKDLNFKNFFISRSFRILPLHLFTLFIIASIEFAKYIAYKNGFSFHNIPFEGKQALSEILPNIFLLQSWLENATTTSFNSPSWSISIEYYIYMIFFVTLLFKNKIKYGIWVFLSFGAFFLLYQNLEVANAIFRGLSCFFAGSITLILYKKYSPYIRLTDNFFNLLELVLILSIIYVIPLDFKHKSVYLSFLFCIVIFTFSFERGFISTILKFNLFQVLGKLSYSIYLIHYSILVLSIVFVTLAEKLLHTHSLTKMYHSVKYIDYGSAAYNNIAIISILILTILLSKYSHKYIELRWQNIGKNYLIKK